MRAPSLLALLSSTVIAAGCDRAAASDDELGVGQLTADSLVETSEPSAAARPAAPRRSEPAYDPAPARVETEVITKTHVKRDAAIGAGVGAAVGAIANDDNRVKGGVVGAIVGGAAGAIVGKTVDKEKVVVPR